MHAFCGTVRCMRIVSLLPSATEMLFALGFDREIVGVSHECDSPLRARTRTQVIRSRIPAHLPPAEIDRLVRDYVSRGESIYAVDADLLESLAPDLIVTQDLCHVCAASPDDLATALARFPKRPEVLCLNPRDLGDVWRDVLWLGQETGRQARAEEIVRMVGERLAGIERNLQLFTRRPRVVLLEWLQPFYVGGHWVPEMIHLAGGIDVLGVAKTPSFSVNLDQLVDAAPDVLFISPCCYRKDQARAEYLSLSFPPEWRNIPAVRNGFVYALDANSYISRPGPRLITGIEAMAKAMHPTASVHAGVESAFLPILSEGQSTLRAHA